MTVSFIVKSFSVEARHCDQVVLVARKKNNFGFKNNDSRFRAIEHASQAVGGLPQKHFENRMQTVELRTVTHTVHRNEVDLTTQEAQRDA